MDDKSGYPHFNAHILFEAFWGTFKTITISQCKTNGQFKPGIVTGQSPWFIFPILLNRMPMDNPQNVGTPHHQADQPVAYQSYPSSRSSISSPIRGFHRGFLKISPPIYCPIQLLATISLYPWINLPCLMPPKHQWLENVIRDHGNQSIDDPGTATAMLREAYHTCQEAGALPASQKVVQHRWAEVTLFQPLAGETENGGENHGWWLYGLYIWNATGITWCSE